MVHSYNYDSEASSKAMRQVEKSLLKHDKNGGVSQSVIASEVGISTPTVSRYLNKMIETRKAHVAGRKDRVTLYKHGPDPADKVKRKRTDPFHLPGGFFGVTK